MVAERPKKDGGIPAMPGGGMGGMAYDLLSPRSPEDEGPGFSRAFFLFGS